MNIKLITASGRSKCRHDKCKRNPEYIRNRFIIKGTICAEIITVGPGGGHSSFYCRDCIELIHDDVRKILNPNLWAFK